MATLMGGIRYSCVVYMLLSELLFVTIEATDVTVMTNAGTFIGIKEDIEVDNKPTQISKFLGIPYAEAPVGNLRFMIPVQTGVFNEPKLVQSYGNNCLQLTNNLEIIGDEDCLFLNVFVPKQDVFEKLAVMVFIHGGAFYFGSGDYPSHVLASYGQVIIVTINYRLGVLGYLSTGDSNAPGNFGLWDQRLAIQWVNENIEAFGGDPTRITLFGESAGAASVVYQGMFTGNKNLFHRMITQSGSSTAPWAIQDHPEQNVVEFSKVSGCTNDSVKAVVDCLRRLPINTLKTAMQEIDSDPLMTPTFVPSTDNVFVSCNARDIFDMSKTANAYKPAREVFASFDFMAGINSGESGLEFIPLNGVLGDPDFFQPNKTYFDNVLVPLFVSRFYGDVLNDTNEHEVVQNVINKYTNQDEPDNPLKIRELFADMYTDVQYLAPMLSAVDTHLAWSTENTYIYYFDVVPSYRFFPVPSWFKWANHGDDLLYFFPATLPLYNPPFSEEETELSKRMIKMWTNFAKTGNPNIPGLNFQWQKYTARDTRYLAITFNMGPESSKKNLGKDKTQFWNNLVTYPTETCTFKDSTDSSNRFKTSAIVTVLCLIICLYI